MRHWDKFTPILPETAEVRILSQLLEHRRKLVQSRVNLSNSITAYLKNYYPQILDWFKEKDTIMFCNFVARWSTLDAIKKVRKQTLFNFFNQHNSCYPAVNEKRYLDIRAAQSLTNDPGVIKPNRIMIEKQIVQFKLLIKSIDRMDREIRQLYKTLEDRKIFDSFPGAGDQFAPRFLAAYSSNRERYHSASELQKYAGIAPVIEQSGKQNWVHWRYNCPTFLRQTCVEWAGLTIRYSFWAKAYYEQQISKGKPHNTVIRALAFKWIRIAYCCWKTNKPYNESTYLNALKKRGSPLPNYAINK